MNQDLPEKKAMVQVPGVKVEVGRDDTWETIGMIAVLVLVIYAGVKAINFVFDKMANRNSLWK